MFIIRSEADERVMAAIEDIKAGCEVIDDFHEWEDVAASSITSVLDGLDDDQYDSTCSAFIRYIRETTGEQKNLAYLQKQVSAFKKNLFDVYKSHLEMISSLPQSDDEDDEEESYSEEPTKSTIMEAARDILTETAASMEAAAKGQTGSIPVHNTGSFPVHTGSLPAQSPLNAEKAEKSEKHEDGEKPDPFRTQSIPIIGGDSKYSELQFGQQNNNK